MEFQKASEDGLKMTSSPKVSVCIVTYNQEKYIRDCLQSIFDQKTNFSFEVIVSDDCSSDGTREIIKEFFGLYGHNMKLYLHEKNIGAFRNFVFVHAHASGDYVCHIDGDDCMLADKLQSQFDHLNSNPGTSFAVHAVKIIGSDSVIGADKRYPTNGSICDLLKFGTYFVNSSVMYRRKLEFLRPQGIDVVDYYLHIERASRGDIYLDRRPLGCYRIHSQGISKSEEYRERIETAYEHAFDRAAALGVSSAAVKSARLNKRMSFAISSYLAGDIIAYRRKICVDHDDLKFASLKHKLLYWTSALPQLAGLYMKIKGMR